MVHPRTPIVESAETPNGLNHRMVQDIKLLEPQSGKMRVFGNFRGWQCRTADEPSSDTSFADRT
ncbi:MAG: hypothetical protein JNK57_12995 [Planctomycetaceae bacterium]|nr:hypothetical protein [Planctomycetaceae bacterium]